MASLYGSSDNPIVEVLIDGVWTDVTSRVRNAQRVQITRGRANEQGRPAPQRAQLTFENPDAYFSTRAPQSVNYRKIGKNTQIRVRAGDGGNHLRTLYNDLDVLAGASTADKASLDVTGDLDLRIEISPHTWRPRKISTLAAKWVGMTDQRSWAWRLRNTGELTFNWSSAGTAGTSFTHNSSVPVPIPSSGRLALRVTIDVDNGSGGKTTTFYTSDSITGTWTPLGTAVTTAGTTSIFNSTSVVGVGRASATQGAFGTDMGYGGKIYRFQMRNGINGTLVADMSPDGQAIGATSFSDGLAAPNTWTIAGTGARLTSDRVRFWGELASLPKEWDNTSKDSIVPARGAGMLQRLSQGVKPIESAMTRLYRGLPGVFAWWPCEDETDGVNGANLAAGSNPRAKIYVSKVAEARFGDTTAPPGAKSSVAFSNGNSRLFGYLKLYDLGLTYSYSFYVKMSALPTTNKTFFILYFTFSRVEVQISNANWNIVWYDLLDNVISSQNASISLVNPVNGWIGYQLLIEDQVGANIRYSQRWDSIGTFGGGLGPTTIVGAAGTVEPRQILFTAANDAAFNDMKISQIMCTTGAFDLSNPTQRNASNAYRGETAAARLQRLSEEEGVAFELTGNAADSEPMGYQTIKTYPDLIAECWETDGGIGGEARDALTLEYRTRADLEARDDLLLTHSASDLSEAPRPTDDDSGFTNDVTLTRQGGASWRSVVTEGYTSISDPPAGVGRYNSEVTLNIATDDRLPSVASWLALTGSWDQDRYPSIEVALHRARLLAVDSLFNATIGLRLGDTVSLAGLPSFMPPDTVAQIVQGYTENLSRFNWDIELNASPAGPFRAQPTLGLDTFTPRLDAVAHTHSNSLTTTGTSLTLVTPAGSARWADSATFPADFPMDIVINGEVMRLTAVTGTTSPQTGTVTRSINGVAKTHIAGSLVRLAQPFYVGR